MPSVEILMKPWPLLPEKLCVHRLQPIQMFPESSRSDTEPGQGSVNLAEPQIHHLENFLKHVILGLPLERGMTTLRHGRVCSLPLGT